MTRRRSGAVAALSDRVSVVEKIKLVPEAHRFTRSHLLNKQSVNRRIQVLEAALDKLSAGSASSQSKERRAQ